MSNQDFYLTTKNIDGQTYLYVQKAVYKGKKRTVRSYSLGNVKKMDEIITRIMTRSENLFTGEYLLLALVQRLGVESRLRKERKKRGATAQQIIYLLFLTGMRVTRPFSKDSLMRYFKHSFFKLLTPVPHVNKIYGAMDKITRPEELFSGIVQQTLKKLNYNYETVYYDTSTIHFFSQLDELRAKGYGKTGPRGAPLVKLGLSCTDDYLPLTYAVRPGNTADITCFKEFLAEKWPDLRKKDTVLSFDAGCYSFEMIVELERQGCQYLASADISAFTLQGTRKTVQINSQEWSVQEALYKGHRIVTGYNEENHQQALEKIDSRIDRVREFARTVAGRTRESRLNKVTDLVKSLGLKCVLTVSEDGETLVIQVNREELKKKKDKAKLLVVVTNLPGSAVQILTRYLHRGEVERAFHYLKTPLEVRPVYHWKECRIHAHFFLVMIGYLQLTALRVYLKQHYQLSLTLDQLLEDLRFATCISLELKEGIS